MLHQLLHLTRSLFLIDCETTGVNVKTDRIIEIGFQQWTAEGLIKEWRSLVNPGVPIPEGAVSAHGVRDERMRLCNRCAGHPHDRLSTHGEPRCSCEEFHPVPFFRSLALSLARGLSNCDFAGKNVRFDLRIIDMEMRREGVPWSYSGARIIDADRLEHLGEPRTLSDLYRKHLGKDPEDAHQALADVQMTAEIISAQLRKYQMSKYLDVLHQLQWPGWIDGDGKFRFVNGVPCVAQWGKHAGKPMKNVDRGYWDFILGGDFSPEVKALASAAKLGKFPEMKIDNNNE